ncbi:MAG: Efflux transporter, RND family, MFP subunit [candidate division WWE3 bacterium GW2011_GWA1_41_8]|uniref:Efflux transporter, RND family, MFP subunit n=1 Tax=candidate division WWE3 bacterium GW2011_GWA1_41_8 TaxID=1619103 RepID=A0A0G0X8U6_UNCKA|nr:MAG: Efflux transporter, RND family, MFP subunit [candidate division WWE3 bacterium GW2011_GWA1_41_8]
MKLSRKRIILIIVATAAIFGLWRFNSVSGVKTVSVKKVEIQNVQISKTITVSGEVRSKKDAQLSFGTSGRIKNINIQEGDPVNTNQLVAALDAQTLSSNLAAAKSSLDGAEKDMELYIENYESNQDAVGGMDEYKIGVEKNQTLVDKATATYRAAQGQVRDTYIYTPFEGKVVSILKKPGESVISGEKVLHIADLDQLYFEILLDQEDFGLVKKGMKAEIILDSYQNDTLVGEVYELQDFTDAAMDNNFKVKILMSANEKVIPRIGMTGDVSLLVENTPGEVSALVYDEIFFDDLNKPFVWVLDGATIKKFEIEIGLEGDIYTEIRTPIDKSVVIGVNSDTGIEEGYKAKVID